MKKLLDVINVGQGDAFILTNTNPYNSVQYDFIIDVGTNKRDLTQFIGERMKIMITHAHSDHLSGFQYFTGDDFKKADTLVLPLQFNEILVLAKMITQLKNIEATKAGRSIVDSLNNILTRCYILGKSVKTMEIIYTMEEEVLFNRFKIWNPPKPTLGKKDLYNEMKKDDFKDLRALFSEETFRSVKAVLEAIYTENIYDTDYRSGFIDTLGTFNLYGISRSSYDSTYNGTARVNLILEYFVSNKEKLISYCNRPTSKGIKALYRDYTEICNDSSIVFTYDHKEVDSNERMRFLFAGDVSKAVFMRLISKGYDLNCDCLKVPHHGGKSCLNKTILKKINPKYAIISHDNGDRGRRNYRHPIIQTISLLESIGCDVYCTNDVSKDDQMLYEKAKGVLSNGCMAFK